MTISGCAATRMGVTPYEASKAPYQEANKRQRGLAQKNPGENFSGTGLVESSCVYNRVSVWALCVATVFRFGRCVYTRVSAVLLVE